jgi:2'-5' RNA ligase
LRLFVAVYPPEEALDHLTGAVSALELGQATGRGVNVRLAARPTWHVTLAFIGEVPDAKLDRAAKAVDRTVAGMSPFSLRIAGGGRFGKGKFTILWTGLAGQLAELRDAGRALRRELRRGRLPYDERPLRPHLTLARVGDRLPEEAVARDLAALDGYQGPQWTVDAVHLVRSQLGPHPRYDRMHSAPVQRGTGAAVP